MFADISLPLKQVKGIVEYGAMKRGKRQNVVEMLARYEKNGYFCVAKL